MLTARLTIIVLLSCLLVGCKFPSLKIPRIYKLSIQQGNVITQEMVDKLKPGMTRSQVAYIMGEPVVRNTFNDARWDYVYSLENPGVYEVSSSMSLFFENDRLAYFAGDLAPTSVKPAPAPDPAVEAADTTTSSAEAAAAEGTRVTEGSGA